MMRYAIYDNSEASFMFNVGIIQRMYKWPKIYPHDDDDDDDEINKQHG